MPVPDFSPGEVLTAAAMDSIGMWKVADGTFTDAASFDVTGFTSTYTNFRLVLNVGRHSGAGGAAITARARTAGSEYATNYFGAGWRVIFNGTSSAVGTRNAGTDFDAGLIQSAASQMLSTLEITGMNTTAREFMVTAHHFDPANSGSTTYGYQCTNLTLSLDRIRFSCGTNMTGNWKLFGYRN